MTGSRPDRPKYTRAGYVQAFFKLHAEAKNPYPQDVAAWILAKKNRRVSANTITEWLKPNPVVPRDVEKFVLVLECLHVMAGKPWPLPTETLRRWQQRRADAYAEARATATEKPGPVQASPGTSVAGSPDEAGLFPAAVSPTGESRDVVAVGKIPAEPVHFVAREQLRLLAQSAATSRVSVVVTGMRGVGKTQLAAAYAREAIDSGIGLVGWVDAETDGALLEGLAAIASRLGVADPEGDSPALGASTTRSPRHPHRARCAGVRQRHRPGPGR